MTAGLPGYVTGRVPASLRPLATTAYCPESDSTGLASIAVL